MPMQDWRNHSGAFAHKFNSMLDYFVITSLLNFRIWVAVR